MSHPDDPYTSTLALIVKTTSEAHARFEENTSESHARFMQVMEQAQQALVAIATNRAQNQPHHPTSTRPTISLTPSPEAITPSADGAPHGWKTLALCEVPLHERAPIPGLEGVIAITPDRNGLYLEIASALTERGLAPHIVQTSETIPRAANAVIWCQALSGADDTDVAHAMTHDALTRYHMLSAQLDQGTFIALRDTGGDLGWGSTDLSGAPFGALDGMAMRSKHTPGARLVSIDLQTLGPQAQRARALVDHLVEGSAPSQCAAITHDTRALAWVDSPPPEETRAAPGDGVILFTGGQPPAALAKIMSANGAYLLGSFDEDLAPPHDFDFDEVIDIPKKESLALFHALEQARRQHGPIRGWVHTLEAPDREDWWGDGAIDDAIWSAVSALGCTMNDPLEMMLLLEDLRDANESALYAMHAELLRAMARAEAGRRPSAHVRYFGFGEVSEDVLERGALGVTARDVHALTYRGEGALNRGEE